MSSTLLQLVQQAMGEMGLPTPTTVSSSADDQVLQCLRLINAAGYELQRQHPWQALTKQYINNVAYESGGVSATAGFAFISFSLSNTTVDATYMVSGTGIPQGTYVVARPTSTLAQLSQNVTVSGNGPWNFAKVKYAMPSDYDRKVDRTDWDKTKHWEMVGPETAQQWEWLLSGFVATGPRIHYRIFGNYYQIWPMISAAEVLGFEYISNAWALATDGTTAKSSFTADTDTCIFPDRLMVLALKLKFWQIKGFDTTSFQRDYDMELGISKANDAGSPTLSMAPRPTEQLITLANVPDSGYGS